MPLKDIQKRVEDWVNQYKIGYFKPLEILARLTEETGELARELNHIYGPKKKKSTEDTEGLESEIGDILFTITCLANSQNINLDKAFDKIMNKYDSRDKDRWEKTPLNWKQPHLELLDKAENFSELKDIAIEVVKAMPQPIGQVCGPISTGGLGSIEENLKMMDKTILKLNDQQKNIFNQSPFEIPMQSMKTKLGTSLIEANQKLLDDFYLPIFESGHIKTLYFISGWESSHGARWEHEKAKELGIDIVYLPENFLEN